MTLLPWPEFDRQGYMEPPDDLVADYYKELAEAALQRLKSVLDTLKRIERETFDCDDGDESDALDNISSWASMAIRSVGEVPPA
jgi:hypothetical protein